MKIFRFLVYIQVVFLFLFCENENNIRKVDDINKNTPIKSDTSCLNYSFYDCVVKYASSIEGFFIDIAKPYYSIYFFKIDSTNFFTIWTFVEFPKYVENLNPDKVFNFYAFNIEERNIIIIDDNSIEELLYKPCSESVFLANQISNNSNNIIYDGSWYPQTYEYEVVNSDVKIKKLDTLLLPILGEDFIRFESYLNEQ